MHLMEMGARVQGCAQIPAGGSIHSHPSWWTPFSPRTEVNGSLIYSIYSNPTRLLAPFILIPSDGGHSIPTSGSIHSGPN